MKALPLILLLSSASVLGVLELHPAHAASFDCSKAGSANEKTICHDPELSAMDDQLGRAYRRARKAATNVRAFRTASDLQWRWREDNCHDRACLVAWYQRRQTELEAQAAPATATIPVAVAQPAAQPVTGTPAPALAAVAPVQPAETISAEAAAALARAALAARAAADAKAATPAPAPVATVAVPAAPAAPAAQSLQLGLNMRQIEHLAPQGSMPWPHYTRAERGQYFYQDPQAGAAQPLVAVRYYGIENGQYILEAVRGQTVLRYTCSADCPYISELTLPGDVEKDTVIVKNDRASLPGLIVSDAVNGLLTPIMSR
ncbi:hypothetical protein HBDW_26100 [Herbaspirillum sp. DW155]|uniref:lysozyme inhibitor LprI family protein n=1 Tax=Herbaspirillum sp. DW155 TaxID=3095609 RepID=UPI00308913F2|nr:hypothetical protein HBDW_26100 [Herbaspirillum sp. DW155]